MQEMQDPFLGWEDPLEKDTQTYTHTHTHASLELQPVMLITLLLYKAENGEVRIKIDVTTYLSVDTI